MKWLQQKIRELSMPPAQELHTSKPDYGKLPTWKMWMPQTENIENLLIFYCGFKSIWMDQVRANNHKYKYTKSKQLNIWKG